ncbi:MAG TPA: hypothetical protein H9716_12295 [Candidatus Enterocloster faecavium]|uniref:Uncharacterized protein n=1 Tax=Candidatus Enterocloster faecavium TaxID=2838560 RepID=A0A9D2LA61_9FIRM|nr:hypothetical protein [Candidatus Enterocloster faecavium]
MKIYVNENHEICAARVNDTGDETLKEYEVPDDYFNGWCDTVIKGYCYQVNEDGSVATYPYKDFDLLMAIQQEHDLQARKTTELQLALAEMYESMEV